MCLGFKVCVGFRVPGEVYRVLCEFLVLRTVLECRGFRYRLGGGQFFELGSLCRSPI